MKFLVLISLFSPLCLHLATALAISNDLANPAVPDFAMSAISEFEEAIAKLTAEERQPTVAEKPEAEQVPETATTAEGAAEFDLSNLGDLLGGLGSPDGESPDISNLAALFGSLVSPEKESPPATSLGAICEDLSSQTAQPTPSLPPQRQSTKPTDGDASTNVLILNALMRGLGPRLPASFESFKPTIPKELIAAGGTPDWEALGQLSFLWGVFKQWQEEEDKARKSEDLAPKIREAVGDLERYLNAKGARALDAFGPLLEEIRKANSN